MPSRMQVWFTYFTRDDQILMLLNLINSVFLILQSDPAYFKQALILANSVVSQLTPGCLFQEWFPPTRAESIPLKLSDNAKADASSTSDLETTPASAALTNNISEQWTSYARDKRSQWSIELGQSAIEVCGVELFIPKSNMPEVLHIHGLSLDAAETKVETASEATSVRLVRLSASDLTTDSSRGDTRHISVSFKPCQVRRINLDFEGFGDGNTLCQHALAYVSFKTTPKVSLKVETRGVLQQLVTWAAKATVVPALRSPALLALQGLGLASGSLHSLLELSFVLLQENMDLDQQQVSSSKRLLLGLIDGLKDQEARVVKLLRHADTDDSTIFSKESVRSGLTLRSKDSTVHFSSTTKMCAVGKVPVSTGSVTWDFVVLKNVLPSKLCFGVSLCTKPSESDYKTSKDLHMLCLDDNRLYSKGVELATRAQLPKLHTGDSLRIIVDLDAGTLSYCKPGDKPVLAFTGLEGPLYPAVCSYGSDRTVKFDVAEFSIIPPSIVKYLSSLEEQDVSVGFGALGKGSDLGYMGKSISLNKKEAKFGLSLHPPTDGKACVTYVIPEGVSVFKTVVGINDDIEDKKTSPITFSVEANGTQLWVSKPLRQATETDECEIKLGDHKTLKLVVACDGAQQDAHAIWFEPVFTSSTELFDRAAVQHIVQSIEKACPDSKTVATAILAVLSEFANVEMNGMRNIASCSTQMAEPFCIEISAETMSRLCALLQKSIANGNDDVAISVLRLIKVNLRRLVVSGVDPALLGIQLTEPPTLRTLHGVLDQLIAQMNTNKLLGREAAAAVDHGLEILYPTAQSRRDLAVKMLEGGATLEIHFEWANKAENEDGRFERLILMLQMECDTRGWPCALYGEFGSYIHLVMKLESDEADKQNDAIQFVLVRFKEIVLATGFDSWEFPTGCESPCIVLKVERYLDFDRKQRLQSDHGVGWVRLYPLSVGSYEDVCGAVAQFASSYDEQSADDKPTVSKEVESSAAPYFVTLDDGW